MNSHRITLALAVGIAALAPAAALAQPPRDSAPAQDLRSADSRTPAQTAQARQDLRPPDVRDVANGSGTANSPRVVVVKMAPSEPVSARGLDWGDASIGAGGLLGLSVIGLGATFVVVHRRRAHHTPPVAGL